MLRCRLFFVAASQLLLREGFESRRSSAENKKNLPSTYLPIDRWIDTKAYLHVALQAFLCGRQPALVVEEVSHSEVVVHAI